MRTIIEKKATWFQHKPTQSKNTAKDQMDIIQQAIIEAKRQAYADMGLYF